MPKHPMMVSAIENAQAAALSTRGMYPLTKAAHVILDPVEDNVSAAPVDLNTTVTEMAETLTDLDERVTTLES